MQDTDKRPFCISCNAYTDNAPQVSTPLRERSQARAVATPDVSGIGLGDQRAGGNGASAGDDAAEEDDMYDWTPPSEAEMEVLRAKRAKADADSEAIGAKLLQGWTLLNENCPNPVCSVPLVADKDGKMFCVSCKNWVIKESDYDPSKHSPMKPIADLNRNPDPTPAPAPAPAPVSPAPVPLTPEQSGAGKGVTVMSRPSQSSRLDFYNQLASQGTSASSSSSSPAAAAASSSPAAAASSSSSSSSSPAPVRASPAPIEPKTATVTPSRYESTPTDHQAPVAARSSAPIRSSAPARSSAPTRSSAPARSSEEVLSSARNELLAQLDSARQDLASNPTASIAHRRELIGFIQEISDTLVALDKASNSRCM